MTASTQSVYIKGLVSDGATVTGQILHNLNVHNMPTTQCVVSESDSAVHFKMAPTSLLLPAAVVGKTLKLSCSTVAGALILTAGYEYNLSSHNHPTVHSANVPGVNNYVRILNITEVSELVCVSTDTWHVIGKLTDTPLNTPPSAPHAPSAPSAPF